VEGEKARKKGKGEKTKASKRGCWWGGGPRPNPTEPKKNKVEEGKEKNKGTTSSCAGKNDFSLKGKQEAKRKVEKKRGGGKGEKSLKN